MGGTDRHSNAIIPDPCPFRQRRRLHFAVTMRRVEDGDDETVLTWASTSDPSEAVMPEDIVESATLPDYVLPSLRGHDPSHRSFLLV